MNYPYKSIPCFHTSSYSFPFEGNTFSNARHAHHLIIKLDIQWISLADIGIIYISIHENLINSLSSKKIINHVVKLQYYMLYIIPSRSYILLP